MIGVYLKLSEDQALVRALDSDAVPDRMSSQYETKTITSLERSDDQ